MRHCAGCQENLGLTYLFPLVLTFKLIASPSRSLPLERGDWPMAPVGFISLTEYSATSNLYYVRTVEA